MDILKEQILLASNSFQSFPGVGYYIGVFLSNYLSLWYFQYYEFLFF